MASPFLRASVLGLLSGPGGYMDRTKGKSMFAKEYFWRDLMTACGLFVIVLTIGIGGFLVYKGSATFLTYGHSLWEFLGSAEWSPADNSEGGGMVGALIFVTGSLCTCGLALFAGIRHFYHRYFAQVRRKILPSGCGDFCRDPLGCIWMGRSYRAGSGH